MRTLVQDALSLIEENQDSFNNIAYLDLCAIMKRVYDAAPIDVIASENLMFVSSYDRACFPIGTLEQRVEMVEAICNGGEKEGCIHGNRLTIFEMFPNDTKCLEIDIRGCDVPRSHSKYSEKHFLLPFQTTQEQELATEIIIGMVTDENSVLLDSDDCIACAYIIPDFTTSMISSTEKAAAADEESNEEDEEPTPKKQKSK